MMNVLIVENKQARPKNLLGEKLKLKLDSLKNVTFKDDITVNEYLDYDIIAVHTSILLEKDILKDVHDTIINAGKYLITFTGGNIGTMQLKDRGKYLQMGSRSFYSARTLNFLEEIGTDEVDQTHLLERMLYGANWRLNYLLKLKNLLWKNNAAKVEDMFGEDSLEDKRMAEEILKEIGYDINVDVEINKLLIIF